MSAEVVRFPEPERRWDPLPSLRLKSTVAHIQDVVARSYKLNPNCMIDKGGHKREITWPRQVAMYLARDITGKSYPTIARLFGGYDHTTIIHACNAVKQRMRYDEMYAEDVEVIRGRLEE
jgi:chromosomal replication initiator protein